MCDKLVFDLSQEIEGSPNVFVRKDWINILDNQNQNYSSNQSIIDTSQLSNSNKYMSYREAYLSIPFLITVGEVGTQTGSTNIDANVAGVTTHFAPNTAGSSADESVGLKNWFGNIIHSFTLDYNGTTIIQQTPFINMWNSFKLMTSLSYSDILTQGATIGFYPDDPLTWSYQVPTGSTSGSLCPSGQGTTNNTNYLQFPIVSGAYNNFWQGRGNEGLTRRQDNISFDNDGIVGSDGIANYLYYSATASRSLLNSASSASQVWKSYISQKQNYTSSSSLPRLQFSVMATVYLKHVHSFFNMVPLLKGVFLKMTMNLNNTTSQITTVVTNTATTATTATATILGMSCSQVSNPVGGVNPLMIASAVASNGGVSLFPAQVKTLNTPTAAAETLQTTLRLNVSVGATCLDQTLSANGTGSGQVSKSVQLYIPAYTFNPIFEQAYLSSPVKQIKYTDVYQYQVTNIGTNQPYNNLLTNGISNIKSVLLLPFYSTTSTTLGTQADFTGVTNNLNTGFTSGIPVYQSPFDPAGCGPTSPLIPITNFNIQVSGQNAIYNTQRYTFEQFNNQLFGQNSVNGGLTDGLTSGLVDRNGFDLEYCYYYVNVERMLPVDMSVPKSIQIQGTNLSAKAIDLLCFVEYGVEISIDALTGARV